MHRQDNPRLELVFGLRGDDHIRFEVLGPTCRHAKTDWERAQLDAAIHITLGPFSGYRSLVMFSDDFHRFRSALPKLLSGEIVLAALESGDFLSVDVAAEANSYNVWMQLDALERNGEMVQCEGGEANWEFRLTMDRASLDELMDSVARVSDRYPTWSVPTANA